MSTVKELAARRASREQEYKQWNQDKKSGAKSKGQAWKRPTWNWDSPWSGNESSSQKTQDWGSKDSAGSSWGSRTRSQSRRNSKPEQEEQPRYKSHSRRRSRSALNGSTHRSQSRTERKSVQKSVYPSALNGSRPTPSHRPTPSPTRDLDQRSSDRTRVCRSRSRRRQHSASSRHSAVPSRGYSQASEPAPGIVFVTADANKLPEVNEIRASESISRQDRHPSQSWARESRNGHSFSRLGSQDACPRSKGKGEVKGDINFPDDLADFANSASRLAFKKMSQKFRTSCFKARPLGMPDTSRQPAFISGSNGIPVGSLSTREESLKSGSRARSGSRRSSHDERGPSLSTVTTQASLTDTRMKSSGLGKARKVILNRRRAIMDSEPVRGELMRRRREANGNHKAQGLKRRGDGGISANISQASEQVVADWSSRCRILEVDTSTNECGIELNMSKASLGDAEIVQWCSWMGEKLSKHKGGYRAKSINFSGNSIGGVGASRLCRLLEMHKVSCEVFKLFKNDLNDESARDVGRYLTSFNRAPVAELHLSHNHISAQGLKWLMACLAMHPAYPRWSEEQQQFLPLWLRVEQNDISPEDARTLLLTINEELDISICFMNRFKCTPTRCCDPGAVSGLKHNCVAHLPFYEKDQGGNSSKSGMAPHSRPFFAAPLVRVPRGPRDAWRQKPFVLYEDDNIACVFKPANWVCNPEGINPKWQHWSKSDREDKLDEILTWRRPVPFHGWILLHFGRQPSFNPSCSYGLAHRLDRDTSGPLLVGKTREGWQFCRDQINGRDLLKSYLCLVHGVLEKPEGECHAPIDANSYAKTRQAKISFETGLAAISIYEALAQYEHPKTGELYTLVHVRIVTGRTHQIRLHMSYLGHSLVGERLYIKDRKVQRDDSDVCPTIFLHKCRIGFLAMDSKVLVRSCSLQMSEDLWKALTKLHRCGAENVNSQSLGSCGMPGAA